MKSSEAFQMYLALRAHFTSKYDYFKYNGKIKAGNLDMRKDKHIFFRLSRTYNSESLRDFYVSNFLEGQTWAGNMTRENWVAWKKRMAWLPDIYKKDLQFLVQVRENEQLTNEQMFNVTDCSHSPLFKSLLAGKISKETFVMLATFGKLFEEYDEQLEHDPVWAEQGTLLMKYRPFLQRKFLFKQFRPLTTEILIEATNEKLATN